MTGLAAQGVVWLRTSLGGGVWIQIVTWGGEMGPEQVAMLRQYLDITSGQGDDHAVRVDTAPKARTSP